MTYVVCESCGCVGLRIHTPSGAFLSHPSYRGVHDHYCDQCGAKLRIVTHKEYHTAYMKTGRVGA